MKNIITNQIIRGLILVSCFVLIIGGIIVGKHGATVIGVIIAGVNVQLWIQWNKKEKKQ